MFEFFLSNDFTESLRQIAKSEQERIKSKLNDLSSQSQPLYFAKKLKGYKDIFRFRCGDYRIIFRLTNNKIILLLVKHRKDVYKGL